ncbi:hypothetical protein LP419_01240 [Massilia sp. H-1]|nr:hypothetical protein LP419_01240 [Massilia sp. H-1]
MKVQAAATDARLAAQQQRLNDVRVQYAPRAKSTTLPPEIKAAEQELSLLANASEMIKRGGFGEVRGFSGYLRALAPGPGRHLADRYRDRQWRRHHRAARQCAASRAGAAVHAAAGTGSGDEGQVLFHARDRRTAATGSERGRCEADGAELSAIQSAIGGSPVCGGQQMKQLTAYWKKLSARVDALSLRERGMLFGMASALIIFTAFFFFLNPAYTGQKILLQTMGSQQDNIAGVEGEITQTIVAHATDPDAAERARLQQLRSEAQALRTSLMAMQQGMVST